MEPLTIAFVTVMFAVALYLTVLVRRDLPSSKEAQRKRQRLSERRVRGR